MKKSHLIVVVVAMLGLAGMFVHSAEADTVTYTFQQGASYTGAEDNLLTSHGTQTQNYGAYGSGVVGNTTWNHDCSVREIMRFDLSSISGSAGTPVESVTLTLQTQLKSGSGTFSVYSIASANKNWVEGTASGAEQAGSSSWKYRIGNTAGWAGSLGLGTSGTDYVATALGSASWTAGTSGEVTIEFDDWTQAALTTLIGSWMTPSTNAGIFLRAANEGASDGYYRWYSKEDATVSNRPKLTIVIPEPLSITLMGFAALPLLLKRRNK